MLDQVVALINRGRVEGDWSELLDWLSEEMSYACDDGDAEGFEPISNATMATLLSLIGSSESAFPSSVQFQVLFFFENEWQRISLEAKMQLFDIITLKFSDLHDTSCKFIVVELLGRFFADHKALLSLRYLSEDKQSEIRQLAAVGTGQLARYASDSRLRLSAKELLQKLAHDPSQTVRSEANGLLVAIYTPH